jgi:hypothetical protein
MMQNEYNAALIEKEAQEYWATNNSFVVVEDKTKEKYFCLSMLPYTKKCLERMLCSLLAGMHLDFQLKMLL